ncbi:Ribosomal n-lysine methyltransferase set10, partial [Globisporangium splendens]
MALLEWIDAHKPRVHVSALIDPVGAHSSGDAAAYEDSDRSIYALDAIAADQELVTLQDDAFLNGSTWLHHLTTSNSTTGTPEDQVAALQKEVQEMQLSPTVQLVMALLYEHGLGEKSRFAGYIAQLPKQIPLPMTWDAKARRALKHTAAAPSIDHELVANMFTSFAAPLATKFPSIWLENVAKEPAHFQWAYTVVSSRAFTIADAKEPTLLPVIDMANHAHVNPCAKIVKTDAGAFQLVALREIAKGEAVTISYGELSNAELLCRYGFVLPESVPNDCILVQSAELLQTYAAFMNDDVDSTSSGKIDDDDNDAEDNNERSGKQPAKKRRKLFAVGAPAMADDALFFLLHGDQSQEFGLSDALLSFVFANDLPADALYDVLAVLLRKRDKTYSDALQTSPSGDAAQQTKLVQLLTRHERDVCRRILIGILSLEEGSSDEELPSDDDDDEDEDDTE